MKKFIVFYLTALAVLFCTAVFAQSDTTGTGVTGTITLAAFSFPLFVLSILPFTGWIKTHIATGINTQTLSWFVAVAVAQAFCFLGLGLFADAGYVLSVFYGLGGALVANGLADIPVVQELLVLISARVKSLKR